MRAKTILLTSLIFIIFAIQANASELAIEFNIVGNTAVVEQAYIFNETQSLTFNLPETAKGVDIYIDEERQASDIKNNRITATGKTIRLVYASKEFIEGETFIANIPFQTGLDRATIRVIGDKNEVLEKPINYEDLTSNSVFPKPSRLVSDGQKIIITWIREDVKKGDELSIFVKFKEEKNYPFFIIAGLAAIVLILCYLLLSKRSKKTEIQSQTEEKPLQEEQAENKSQKEQKYPEIEKHLKEDEEQIINILKQKEGHCEQGTLVIITGFSKAKLSAILKELEERKIVYKEQKGNKNIIHLKTE